MDSDINWEGGATPMECVCPRASKEPLDCRMRVQTLRSNPVTHSVEDRTTLHFLTLQKGHVLGKRERLCAPKGIFGSNPGISETVGRAEIPVFAGLLGHYSAKNQETGRVGWSERIRTHAFPIEPGLHCDNRQNREPSRWPSQTLVLPTGSEGAAPKTERSRT